MGDRPSAGCRPLSWNVYQLMAPHEQPYTRMLINAAPNPDARVERIRNRIRVSGEQLSPLDPEFALRFLPSRPGRPGLQAKASGSQLGPLCGKAQSAGDESCCQDKPWNAPRNSGLRSLPKQASARKILRHGPVRKFYATGETTETRTNFLLDGAAVARSL